jgi:hypothetical protein
MTIRIIEAVFALGFPLTCAAKGRWISMIAGVACPLLWIIGAGRRARPGSWWGRRCDCESRGRGAGRRRLPAGA